MTSHIRGHMLYQYLPHLMKSCTEGLIPFPYAYLSSLLKEFQDKNTNFSTCTHFAYYTESVYACCSTTAHVHRDLFQKMKLNVRFLCHDRRSLILGLLYTGNVLNHPFNSILKAIKKSIPSYGKGERIQL
jgi:hypothetical protein